MHIGPSVCQNLHVCNQCVGLAASPGMLWYVCAGVDIQSSESMEAYIQKPGSLSKHQLIVQYLRDDGQVVHQSNLDTDTLIVQCALQFAIEGSKVCCS